MFQPFEGSTPPLLGMGLHEPRLTEIPPPHWVRETKRGHQQYQVDTSLDGAHGLDLEDEGR